MSNKFKSSFFWRFSKRLIKKIKLRNLLLIAILFSSNTFAWFLYATKVSNSITAHVKSWNVNFVVEDNNIEETLTFNVESIYPGMPTATQKIKANNYGDTPAKIEYSIISAEILGEEYKVSDTLTNDDLISMLKNDFPFSLIITIDNEDMEAHTGEATINFNLVWPYESGNDELDTIWGHKAYIFNENNPNKKNISLIIKVTATQKQDN